jgi:hypothetical protein
MFTVTPEAKKYIEKNGGAVTVGLVMGGGGCCAAFAPVTVSGRPPDGKNYRLLEADGIQLFVHNSVRMLPGGINIGLASLFWTKKLEITGLDI